jgi:hypothetical protein
VSLIFRGQDLHEDGLDLQLTSGFFEPVSVRGKDVIVPANPGRFWRPRRADVRTLKLEGWVKGRTPEEWNIATYLLSLLIDTTLEPGELRIEGPYLGFDPGFVATINATTVNAISGPILGGMTFQRWDVELESVDPNWVLGGGSGS